MINYNKNKLINQTLDKYYDTFSHMLDTSDFVPEKYNSKIGKYIFKNMKRHFKLIDKEDRKFQRKFRKKNKEQEKQAKKLEKANKPKREKWKFLKKLFKRKGKGNGQQT